jgi:hypothetical protein
MNQVDIYIGDYRLDLFQDEEISINLNVQNIQDISKVFTDFTQSFTIPASGINNEVLKQYYRTDVDASRITTSSTTNYPIWNDWIGAWETQLQTWGGGSSATSVANNYDFRLRVPARIEINSIPFRTGVIEMENVLMKGTEPYSYSIAFYGDLVSLSDLFGEDYLYDLDLSAYDHAYDGATILQGFNQDALFGGEVFYPLMSPVRNWVYNVSSSSDPRHEDDIQFVTGHSGHHHGIHYNELKPAVKVVKILEAIEAKYGISFTGSFMSDTQFNKLYLWAHRFEGQLYDNASAIDWQLVNFDNLASGTFDIATDTWTVPTGGEYKLRVDVYNSSANYELGLFRNGVQIAIGAEDANAGTTQSQFEGFIFQNGDEIQLKIRPQLPANMTYQVTGYDCYTAPDGIPTTLQFDVDQTGSATYSFQLAMSPLMPEIKIKDFFGGVVKMHNLVIVPTDSTTFSLQTLNAWYAGGTDQDITQYVDINEVSVERPQLYREISFDYQDTEQILGYEYQRTNQVGFGDLNSFFSWDGEEFQIELPFECPLFERLTDIDTGDLTNILVYKSQTREVDTAYDNRFQPYVGAPILIYGDFSLDISANPISFVDESDTATEINQVWYANTSSTSIGTGLAYTITWGADIDPYYLTSVAKSLYQTYWEDYILDLYNAKRRIYNVSALLPLGKIINLQLNNKLIWNNQKWIINSANVNMTTGKVAIQLLNDV